jgi:ribonuclease III
MPASQKLQDALGVKFDDPGLLETALVHRSYMNEHRKTVHVHNERLEFLGDAVLELVVTEFLYLNYSDPEGILTNWRSALVKTESLSETAAKLELNKYVKLSRGEARGSERARQQILANALEAVIGAIYLDRGYETAKSFIGQHINSKLPAIIKSGTWQDAKTKLQEMMQEKEGLTPTYKVLSEEGPDHNKMFTVGVYVGKKLRGKGSGTSKQEAQQAAAEKALAST